MLEHFPFAVSVIDLDLNIIAFNQKFLTHLDFPAGLIEPGVPMAKVFRYNAERGEYGPGDPQEQVRQRLALAAQFLPHRYSSARARTASCSRSSETRYRGWDSSRPTPT